MSNMNTSTINIDSSDDGSDNTMPSSKDQDFYVSSQASVPKALQETLSSKERDPVSNSTPGFTIDPVAENVSSGSQEYANCTFKDFFSFAFYQHFFDVSDKHVMDQLKCAALPYPDRPFLHPNVKPDLYGPVWISATLVVIVAICSNLASYSFYIHPPYHVGYLWHYNFHITTLALTLIFSFVIIVPLIIMAILRYFVFRDEGNNNSYLPIPISIVHLISLYGYSLLLYIPTSVLLTFQSSIWQWLCTLVLFGATTMFTLTALHSPLTNGRNNNSSGSTNFLSSFWSSSSNGSGDMNNDDEDDQFTEKKRRKVNIVFGVIATLNFLMVVIFMLTFFRFTPKLHLTDTMLNSGGGGGVDPSMTPHQPNIVAPSRVQRPDSVNIPVSRPVVPSNGELNNVKSEINSSSGGETAAPPVAAEEKHYTVNNVNENEIPIQSIPKKPIRN